MSHRTHTHRILHTRILQMHVKYHLTFGKNYALFMLPCFMQAPWLTAQKIDILQPYARRRRRLPWDAYAHFFLLLQISPTFPKLAKTDKCVCGAAVQVVLSKSVAVCVFFTVHLYFIKFVSPDTGILRINMQLKPKTGGKSGTNGLKLMKYIYILNTDK